MSLTGKKGRAEVALHEQALGHADRWKAVFPPTGTAVQYPSP